MMRMTRRSLSNPPPGAAVLRFTFRSTPDFRTQRVASGVLNQKSSLGLDLMRRLAEPPSGNASHSARWSERVMMLWSPHSRRRLAGQGFGLNLRLSPRVGEARSVALSTSPPEAPEVNLHKPRGPRLNYCGVAQLAARVAHNHEVVGSSPAPAIMSSTKGRGGLAPTRRSGFSQKFFPGRRAGALLRIKRAIHAGEYPTGAKLDAACKRLMEVL